MKWQLDTSRPIYLQIIDRVRMEIAAGRYHPGQQLPSVRDFSMEAGVNPNTMQKALTELERSGLVKAQRTSGRFITEDEELIIRMRDDLAEDEIRRFLQSMATLGITKKELISKLENETMPESGILKDSSDNANQKDMQKAVGMNMQPALEQNTAAGTGTPADGIGKEQNNG